MRNPRRLERRPRKIRIRGNTCNRDDVFTRKPFGVTIQAATNVDGITVAAGERKKKNSGGSRSPASFHARRVDQFPGKKEAAKFLGGRVYPIREIAARSHVHAPRFSIDLISFQFTRVISLRAAAPCRTGQTDSNCDRLYYTKNQKKKITGERRKCLCVDFRAQETLLHRVRRYL